MIHFAANYLPATEYPITATCYDEVPRCKQTEECGGPKGNQERPKSRFEVRPSPVVSLMISHNLTGFEEGEPQPHDKQVHDPAANAIEDLVCH